MKASATKQNERDKKMEKQKNSSLKQQQKSFGRSRNKDLKNQIMKSKVHFSQVQILHKLVNRVNSFYRNWSQDEQDKNEQVQNKFEKVSSANFVETTDKINQKNQNSPLNPINGKYKKKKESQALEAERNRKSKIITKKPNINYFKLYNLSREAKNWGKMNEKKDEIVFKCSNISMAQHVQTNQILENKKKIQNKKHVDKDLTVQKIPNNLLYNL